MEIIEQSFLKNIEQFLAQQNYKYSREQRDAAIKLIQQHYRNQHYRSKGPCLFCSQEILYTVSVTHSRMGDEWLNKIVSRIKSIEDISIKIETHRWKKEIVKVCGQKPETIYSYLCPECRSRLEARITQEIDKYNKAIKVEQEQKECEQQEYRSKMWAVFKGQTESTISERFKALQFIWHPNYEDELKNLNYSDFLQSAYWDTIRRYKLQKSSWKCELCNSNGELHVHHKTYEHHGLEHQYLNDLIVLCKNCHKKHHDIEE